MADNLVSLFFDGELEDRTITIDSYSIRIKCYNEDFAHYDGLTGHIPWVAASPLSEFIVNNSSLFTDTEVIELGSGLGISGIFSSFFSTRTFLTDYEDDILLRLNDNISLNQDICSRIQIHKLDWTSSEDSSHLLSLLSPSTSRVIIGSDVVYQHGNVFHLCNAISQLIGNGVAFLVNSRCRFIGHRDDFYEHCHELDLEVQEFKHCSEADLVWLKLYKS
ncbi:hypothetical protein GEMRC1_005736 [Eukaryota sp. GEM-RC1]